MSILRVLKYLVMGVVVGAVLFFAGFGVLNLVDKNAESEVVQNPAAIKDPNTAELSPPTITVTSTADPAEIVNDASNPIKIKPLDSEDQSGDETTDDAADAVAFGSLTLSTVTAANNQPVNADFLIQNSENAVIALVKKTAATTLSLPVGNYKITVTQADQKIVRFLGVREGQQGAEVFELDLSDAVAKANTPAAGTVSVIADDTTAVTDSSTSGTSELVDEVAPVTAEGTDVATTVTETATAAETDADATQTATAEAETDTETAEVPADGVGGLRVSALTKEGKRPVKASFYIQRLNGENVDNRKNVETEQFSLPAGRYRVTARTQDVRLVEDVDVLAGKGLHQIFLVPEPETAAAPVATPTPRASAPAPRATTPEAPARVATPTRVPVAPPTPAATPRATAPSTPEPSATGKTGRLELFAQRASNQSAVKSNFYIQTPDGKLVTNKTYVDSIGYKLPVGRYRVTVRANGFVDKTVDMRVRDGQTRREVFKLEPIAAAPQPAPVSSTPIPVIPPAPIVVQPPVAVPQAPQVQQQASPGNPNRRGGLQVNIISARDGSGLIADIAVVNGNGRVIRRADGVSTANFALPAREFMVRVIYGGLITNEKVMIQPRKIAIKTIRFSERQQRGVRQ
ncbi:hypothetical protein [Leucothrix mucor]|uniref:hypothetical protein n=1 Tax=Leucothrix mucor TaxID=45248 RepID=UPI0003B488A1|nr:hypothetical protein [Leucothrix mucor]